VYLALHGSMQVVGLGEAPEQVILRRVRGGSWAEPRRRASRPATTCTRNLSPGIVDPSTC
jgi:hypothetical protein